MPTGELNGICNNSFTQTQQRYIPSLLGLALGFVINNPNAFSGDDEIILSYIKAKMNAKSELELELEYLKLKNIINSDPYDNEKIILKFNTIICGKPELDNDINTKKEETKKIREIFNGINFFSTEGIEIKLTDKKDHTEIINFSKKNHFDCILSIDLELNWKNGIENHNIRNSMIRVFDFIFEKYIATPNDRKTQLIFLLMANSILKQLSQIKFNNDSMKKLNDQFVVKIKEKFPIMINLDDLIIKTLPEKEKIKSATSVNNE